MEALEQINMETCHVSMATWCWFWLVKNRTPQNMNLEIYHPPKHVKFQQWPNTCFNAWAT
jgi:hypothetical protein